MSLFSDYLIVTDLDGTFFDKQGKIVPRNREAGERFCAGGGKFTIATGRPHLNIRNAFGDPVTLLNAPAVVGNGAYLYDFAAKTAFDETLLPEKDARALLAFTRARCPDVQFRVSARDALRLEEVTGFLAHDIVSYDAAFVHVSRPAEAWRADDWYKIVFRAEPERLAEVRKALDETFGDHFSVAASGARLLEVQDRACDKAAGVLKLRRRIAAEGKPRTLIVCGDYENDIPMLRVADLAIAPANALPVVKEMADLVLCDHTEGLIADVIDRIEAGELTVKGKK